MARKRGITRDDVVATAAAIADAEGLAAATLTAVATRLGVATPSLYSHVDGVAGLRRWLALAAADALDEAFTTAARSTTGTDRLRAIGRAYRDFARTHPGLYAALLPAPRPGDDDELYAAMARPVAVVSEVLDDLGADPHDAVHLTRVLRSLLHGFADLEAAGGFGMPVDLDESFSVALDVATEGIARGARGADSTG